MALKHDLCRYFPIRRMFQNLALSLKLFLKQTTFTFYNKNIFVSMLYLYYNYNSWNIPRIYSRDPWKIENTASGTRKSPRTYSAARQRQAAHITIDTKWAWVWNFTASTIFARQISISSNIWITSYQAKHLPTLQTWNMLLTFFLKKAPTHMWNVNRSVPMSVDLILINKNWFFFNWIALVFFL